MRSPRTVRGILSEVTAGVLSDFACMFLSDTFVVLMSSRPQDVLAERVRFAPARMMANAKPQAVILVSVSGPAPKIVQAYRAVDENALLYGLSILSSDAMYKALGDKVRGMIIAQTVPYPWNRTNRVTTAYQDVMKATGVKDISVAGMEGFIAARMLVEALKTAGKAPTSESFTKVLENTGEQDLGGYRYRYTADDHGATHYVDITLIGKGGKLLR